ncbi:hypothetical protein BT63DRAFT_425762 [Microthyrium microscopicum]|uniref:Amino acid transporter n=1 Tax=Microthyrium microscopicum TaxID=703497 RepID=A0A6A6UAV3_9PEZI|nr:hypothetical protein BT63DRAFT_425762 [Microthyrium microscopicum]
MAGNAIMCGIQLLKATHPEGADPDGRQVRGIAICLTTGALFIHGLSRRGGLALSNCFAVVKLGMLLVIIGTTIAYLVGSIGPSPALETTAWAQQPFFSHGTISKNTTFLENIYLENSFKKPSNDPHGYSDAFLAVIYTFWGFEQANYVLGEINSPHRKFPIALGLSVSIVSVLYVAVNICYWAVVPQYIAAKPNQNIAEAFFTITLGSLRPDYPYLGIRIASAFIAVSTLGNLIVMSYTATRVKQEIAKEGFLPLPKFFVPNYDISIGRIIIWMQRMSFLPQRWPFSQRWLAPINFREGTPVGASILHLISCSILFVATAHMRATDAYIVLTGISSYLINGFFGCLLALGILWLRLFRSKEWKKKSAAVRPSVSIAAAAIYLVLNALPVISNCMPSRQQSPLKWYLLPLVSWGTLVCGLLWYLGFLMIVRRKDRKTNTVIAVIKRPDVREDPPYSGIWVQVHETSFIDRLPTEEADRFQHDKAINIETRDGADV